MFRHLAALLALSAAAVATAAGAAPQSVSGNDLSEKVPGARIDIDTPIGTKIPMTFGRDGIVSGEAGAMLSAFLGAAKDRGRWWVAGNRLCIKWFRWFDGQQRCMDIKLDGARIHWTKDDGESGTGTLTLAEQPAGQAAATTGAPSAAPLPKTPSRVAVVAEAKAAAAPPAGSGAATAGVAVKEIMAEVSRDAAPARPAPRQPSALGGPPDAGDEGRAAAEARPDGPPPLAPILKNPAAKTTETREPAPAAADQATAPTAQRQEKIAAAVTPNSAVKPATAAKLPAKEKAAASPRSTAPKVPTFRVANVAADDMLNVRSGPAEETRPVGAIGARGRGVVITGPCQGEWCPIRHAGVSGWVNRYYLVQEDVLRRTP